MATAFNKEVKSNRLLQSKRYTLGSFTDSVESYTNVFDLGAGEIYTQTNYIPTSSLPFSGSSQDFFYYTTGSTISTTATGNDVLRYWSKHKLTPGANGAAGDQVWFFISGSTLSSVGEQGINDDQQTNFISNKYIEPSLAFNHAENATPGYNIIAYASNNGSTFTEIANTKYVFDYKTGVFQWLTEANKNEYILNSNYFVYVSAYQYVGKTLESQIIDGSIGGGSGASSWTELTGIPENLLSGSEQIASDISGSTRIYVSGSNGGFELSNDSTLNIIPGTAGVTALSNGSNTITIGANTDNVNFNDISASGNFVLNGTSQITSPNLDSTGQEYGNIDLTTVDVYNDFWSIPVGTFKAHGLRVGSGSYTNASDEQFSLLQLGTNYIIGGSGATDGARAGLNFILSGSGNQGTTHKLRFYADDAGNEILRFGYNDFLIKGTDDVDSNLTKKGFEFNSSNFKIYSGSGTSTVFNVSRQTKAATFAGEVTATGGFVGDLTGTASIATTALSASVTYDNSTNRVFGLVFADTGSGVALKTNYDFSSGGSNKGLTYHPVTDVLSLGSSVANNYINLDANYGGNNIVAIHTGYNQTAKLFPTVTVGQITIGEGLTSGDVTIGSAASTTYFAGSASIAGDLTVQGTVTSIQTENLNVSDQFILLASGSTGTKDGGIIVQSGSNGVGTALYFDANANRWAVNPANSVNWNDTSLTPKQYVVSVSASAASPTSTPQDFGGTGEYYGMMHVNTDNGEIWIYS